MTNICLEFSTAEEVTETYMHPSTNFVVAMIIIERFAWMTSDLAKEQLATVLYLTS